MSDDDDQVSLDLADELPADQFNRVMNQRYVDIAPEFLGFVKTYKLLAELIPRHFTVVDLGCAYNPQYWYFRNHKALISVDGESMEMPTERFMGENNTIYLKTIGDFMANDLPGLKLDMQETFAIVNYVPNWYKESAGELARKHFSNLYVFYPHGPTSDVKIMKEILQKVKANQANLKLRS